MFVLFVVACFFIYVSKMSECALKLFCDKQNVQQFKDGISKYDFKGMCHFLPVQNHVQFNFLQGTKTFFCLCKSIHIISHSDK